MDFLHKIIPSWKIRLTIFPVIVIGEEAEKHSSCIGLRYFEARATEEQLGKTQKTIYSRKYIWAQDALDDNLPVLNFYVY